MIETFLLFAQKNPANGGIIVQFMPFILIAVLFWFLIIRPQRKRDKDHQGMLNSLKSGDQVITRSGIYGEIAEVTPQSVIVEIAPRVKVSMQKQAIAAVTPNTYSGKGALASSTDTKEESNSSNQRKKKKRKK